MTEEIVVALPKAKKKSLFKRWWFWGLALIVLVIIISSASGGEGGSNVFELSKATQMSKQQIVEKFGKPTEVVRDDKDGYNYSYNKGFTISGTDKGAENIVLSSAFVKDKSNDSYKIFDVQLDSSFQENVKRLGTPQLNLNKDNQNLAVYLTKEGYILTFSSTNNDDKVSAIEFSEYDSSTLSMALDISKLLNNKATENDIKQNFTIKQKSPEAKVTTYFLDGCSLVLDNKDQNVTEVFINSDSIYNINGIRTSDSMDKALKLFGEPIQKADGVKNTTQYVFNVDNAGQKNKLHVTADNASKQIQYIGLTLK